MIFYGFFRYCTPLTLIITSSCSSEPMCSVDPYRNLGRVGQEVIGIGAYSCGATTSYSIKFYKENSGKRIEISSFLLSDLARGPIEIILDEVKLKKNGSIINVILPKGIDMNSKIEYVENSNFIYTQS